MQKYLLFIAHMLLVSQAFQGFPQALLKKVCRGIFLEYVKPNAIVCEEDEPGDSMFIVLSGACDIRAQAPPDQPVQDDDSNTVKPCITRAKYLTHIRGSTEVLLCHHVALFVSKPF